MAVSNTKFKLKFENKEQVESITSKIQSLVDDCQDKQRANLIASGLEKELLAMVVTGDNELRHLSNVHYVSEFDALTWCGLAFTNKYRTTTSARFVTCPECLDKMGV